MMNPLDELIASGHIETFYDADGERRARLTPMGAYAIGNAELARALTACALGDHAPLFKGRCACSVPGRG